MNIDQQCCHLPEIINFSSVIKQIKLKTGSSCGFFRAPIFFEPIFIVPFRDLIFLLRCNQRFPLSSQTNLKNSYFKKVKVYKICYISGLIIFPGLIYGSHFFKQHKFLLTCLPMHFAFWFPKFPNE